MRPSGCRAASSRFSSSSSPSASARRAVRVTSSGGARHVLRAGARPGSRLKAQREIVQAAATHRRGRQAGDAIVGTAAGLEVLRGLRNRRRQRQRRERESEGLHAQTTWVLSRRA